jgi:hypothetical protein
MAMNDVFSRWDTSLNNGMDLAKEVYLKHHLMLQPSLATRNSRTQSGQYKLDNQRVRLASCQDILEGADWDLQKSSSADENR